MFLWSKALLRRRARGSGQGPGAPPGAPLEATGHTVGRRGPDWRRGVLGALALAFALLVLVLFAAALAKTYHAVEQRQRDQASMVADMVESSLTRTLESAETALLALANKARGVARLGPDQARDLLTQDIASLLSFAPHLRQIVVTDHQGWVVLDSAGSATGHSLDLGALCPCVLTGGFVRGGAPRDSGATAPGAGDRLILRPPEMGQSRGLGLGTPVPGRFLPILGPDRPPAPRRVLPVWLAAGPDTLVIAALNPGYLENILREPEQGPLSAVRLVRFDGSVILEQADPAGPFADLRIPLIDQVAEQRVAGLLPVVAGGRAPLGEVAYHLSSRYPLAVQVGLARADVLRAWLDADGMILLWSLLSLVGLLATLAILWRQTLRSLGLESRIQLLSLTQSAFANAAEGMVITDQFNRIVATNAAFSAITGYSLEEVKGQDPKILASGRHDSRFYAELWQALEETGSWRGEIWNRRRDGSLYAQRLTISRIADDRGQPRNYIGIFNDITEQRRWTEALHYLANHDPLTGLPNRVLLEDRLSQALTRAGREGSQVALLFIDLDGFKPINDRFGHALGDLVLKVTAGRIAAALRDSDTVARLGGDEFVVLLLSIKSVAGARTVADKILADLSAPIPLEGDDIAQSQGAAAGDAPRVTVGASLGIALFPQHGPDGPALVAAADAAMYQAKAAGRGSVRVAEDVPPHGETPPRPP